jgi:class 3 adenylate cyclase
VLFCDLVDSTGIAARLDAEEWRDLVGAYVDAASTAITEMGGHVAKKLGDGLMALFGYPLAHENDAERASRAALSIQRGIDLGDELSRVAERDQSAVSRSLAGQDEQHRQGALLPNLRRAHFLEEQERASKPKA